MPDPRPPDGYIETCLSSLVELGTEAGVIIAGVGRARAEVAKLREEAAMAEKYKAAAWNWWATSRDMRIWRKTIEAMLSVQVTMSPNKGVVNLLKDERHRIDIMLGKDNDAEEHELNKWWPPKGDKATDPKPHGYCGTLCWFVRHAIKMGDIAGNLSDRIQNELAELREDAEQWRAYENRKRKDNDDGIN